MSQDVRIKTAKLECKTPLAHTLSAMKKIRSARRDLVLAGYENQDLIGFKHSGEVFASLGYVEDQIVKQISLEMNENVLLELIRLASHL